MPRRYQRALITGATSGIGAAFARELAPRTDLLLTGRDPERLQAIADEVACPGRRVETMVADLADEAAVHALAEWAAAAEIDLLVNNAGVGRLGRVLELSLEEERDTVAVNVLAVLLLTRSLLPGMVERADRTGRRAGVIILSSTAAFSAVPYFATYAASKAFDLSFAEALAEEMRGQPVDVLALCPGATRTSFAARAGLSLGSLPGAADPGSVARSALQAIGRQTVKVTGLVDQAALGPLLLPRTTLTGLVGTAMRLVNKGKGLGGRLQRPAPMREPRP